ncbi:MAG: hypothetical protein V1776_01910 [Candidatus Diapherotrites archaeon]
MAFDFEEMRRIYRLEKSTARLVDVPEDFFTLLHTLVEDERKKYFDSLNDLNTTRARDFGNLKKLVDEWFVVREKKLLNTVLVSAQLGEMDLAHLTVEEKRLFTQLYDTLRAHRNLTQSILDANSAFVGMVSLPVENETISLSNNSSIAHNIPLSNSSPLSHSASSPSSAHSQSASSSSSLAILSVRILSEIPSFVGTDLKEYGPYKTGEVVSLPSKIAQLFISRKLGESVV